MNTCGFCGSPTGVRTIVLRNGYNVDKECPIIACGPCIDILLGMAMVLSLYTSVE